ncbi:MAG: GntR family transcriptional regulator [Bacteroidota bacterium]
MWFHIDPSSGTPIYLQIVEQVKQAVAGGVLKPGQRLPATRDLAIELAVNPNTVVKAYQALEREGLIVLPRGRGAFIAESPQHAPEERLVLLRPSVERLVAEAYRLGCTADDVLALLRENLAKTYARRTEELKEHRTDGT